MIPDCQQRARLRDPRPRSDFHCLPAQAWLPKIVVVLGISLAIWTVLLFPLDVANRSSCKVNALRT